MDIIQTQPINIIQQVKTRNYSSSPQKIHYKFELVLNKEKTFTKYSCNTYAHLITIKDKIRFSYFKSFKITIYINSNVDSILEGDCTKDNLESDIIYQNDNIFIEFSRVNNDYLYCSCFIKNNNCIVSPPN